MNDQTAGVKNEKNKFQIKREETFESFIDAGLHLLIERAYDSVSIDDISKAAGFSKGAFYVHFESKEDFLKHLLERRQIKKGSSLAISTN